MSLNPASLQNKLEASLGPRVRLQKLLKRLQVGVGRLNGRLGFDSSHATSVLTLAALPNGAYCSRQCEIRPGWGQFSLAVFYPLKLPCF